MLFLDFARNERIKVKSSYSIEAIRFWLKRTDFGGGIAMPGHIGARDGE